MAQHHDETPCDSTPVKYAFHDTTLHTGDSCWLTTPTFKNYITSWSLPSSINESDDFEYNRDDILVSCSQAENPRELTMSLWNMIHTTVSNGYTGLFSYTINAINPECSDREGDSIYITFAVKCDTTPVRLAFHDTAFCEGDSLLLVATDQPHDGYSTLWINLSSAAEVIYEGDSLFVTEPGTYAFRLYNMVNNGCPDREGDTVGVAFWPKPQAFLPQDTLEACGGRSGALTFASGQPHIACRWSDGDTASAYRFAYKGDTLDQRFCTLFNVCGDTLTDSVTVRFLPPYAYLGGDSLVGCRGDSVLFDMGQYNRHLPHYDNLRFIWTLRGDTLRDGQPGAANDPARLWVRFPQDTGLLTVSVFLPDNAGEAPDGGDDAPACPVAADTIRLQLYPWPDIDFFVRNGDTTVCHYDSIPLFLDRDSLVFSPDAYYIWLFDSVPFDTTADKIIHAAEPGLYTVTGVNYCSRHSESFILSHYPKERITATVTDTAMCPDIPVEMDATLPFEGNLYVWFSSGEAGEDDEANDDGEGGDYSALKAGIRQFRNPE
ncbi:MAG: hypothetical protein K2H70_03540, partial [Bacteroidales bacterium]|nr:hypothetical protein [Bacteroidales bacterium]